MDGGTYGGLVYGFDRALKCKDKSRLGRMDGDSLPDRRNIYRVVYAYLVSVAVVLDLISRSTTVQFPPMVGKRLESRSLHYPVGLN